MPSTTAPGHDENPNGPSLGALFLIFLRLGCTSFGGPVAHLGYFRDEFVLRRRWLGERAYADLVALCQFLPGPASSQVGMAIGLSRGGYAGLALAWCGFTLPSAVALILFALGVARWGDSLPAGLLDGLKIAAVAVVAQAVWGMGRSLCPDPLRIALMIGAAALVSLWSTALAQVAVILLGGLVGLWRLRPEADAAHEALPVTVSRRAGLIWLALFAALLVGLPLLAEVMAGRTIELIAAFSRAGALVFGGGHVVLPLLQAEVVPTGWVENATFLAGYGAAQAVPGPLFTFSAFLGASLNGEPSGWLGGSIALLAIFAPSYLLIVGALPFWEGLRRSRRTRAALMGINAAVVGLLLAALYDPVWTSAVDGPAAFMLAVAAFFALVTWRLPPWLVVLGCALLGVLLQP
ncbi:chromate efflux transporter [Stutzerimonas urumqiensis]|uniref:chromate efflux transporter n=1 Tax=Stutzerimonas urumqiensis TaxID=638269 RepID=UPI003BAA0BBF